MKVELEVLLDFTQYPVFPECFIYFQIGISIFLQTENFKLMSQRN